MTYRVLIHECKLVKRDHILPETIVKQRNAGSTQGKELDPEILHLIHLYKTWHMYMTGKGCSNPTLIALVLTPPRL